MSKAKYEQKFRDAWLKDPDLKEWVTRVQSTSGEVTKCRVCNSILRNHYGDLKSHAKTVKHKQNMKSVFGSAQSKINFPRVNEVTAAKMAEAKLSLFIAEHTAHLCEHLVDICKVCFNTKDSCTDQLQMRKTKCSGIINNVLAPHFVQDFIEDIGQNS